MENKKYNQDLIAALSEQYGTRIVLISDPEEIPGDGPFYMSTYQNTLEELCQMYPLSTIYVHEPSLPAVNAAVLASISRIDPVCDDALTIKNADAQEVFSIKADGTVCWMDPADGETRQVTMENDLAQAFAICVSQMAGVSAETVIKDIRSKVLLTCSVAVADYLADHDVDPEVIESVKQIMQ